MIRFRAAVSNPLALVAILIASTLLSPFASPAHAFHFPWDQGHDTFSPTTPPDPGLCKGSNCNPCNSSSSPVYVPTGHFVWSDTDIVLRGRPYIGLTRTYNSNDPRGGLFGNGWSVGCDVGLYATTSGSELHFVYRAPDGKRYEYVVQPDGTVMSPPGRFEQILPQPDGTAQILYLDNTRQVFRVDGRLGATLDANANRIDYSYDGSDRLVAIADTNGRSLTLTYNASGRVARVTDHGGRVWQYEYDPDGNLMTVTDPLGGVRRYEYAAFTPEGGDVTYHQLTKITDASGVVVTQVAYAGERVASYTEAANRFSYAYNTATKTVTKTDLLSSRLTFIYNDDGLITQETDPLGNGIIRAFDTNGRETSRTDQIGAVWNSTYDGLGRILSVANPLGETMAFVYSGVNPFPVRTISPSGRAIDISYDARLNPLAIVDPARHTTLSEWSSTGDLVSSVDAIGQRTSFAYNAIGLPITATDPMLGISEWSYDALARMVTAHNQAGEVAMTTYDVLDRPLQTTDPMGHTTSYSYDQAGRLKSVTDANGGMTTFGYDAVGRLATTTSPDGRVRTMVYRADNLISQITGPDLRVIAYFYDAAKRLVQEDAAGEVTTFSYNGRGELVGAVGLGGDVSFTFDLAGRVIQEMSSGQSVQSTFSNEGERITLAGFGATTSYSRDVRGLVTTIKTSSGSIDLEYDALARRTRLAFPNLTATGYRYDANGRLSAMSHTGLFAATYDYTFDLAGRITRQTGDGPDWQYSYDTAGRLVAAIHGGEQSLYSYDGIGNIVGGGRVHDRANRLTEDALFTYSYDPNGNLGRKVSKASGAQTVYTWNVKNQLLRTEQFTSAAATVPTKTLVFAYDPLGRRVAKTEDGILERYVYDGANLIAALDSSGVVVRRVTSGPDVDQPLLAQYSGSEEFFQTNHLGSVVAATSGSTVTATYNYGPYGETRVTGAVTNAFRYTAREQDASDLYYYRTRYYDPTIARFLSEDELGLLSGPNVYAYVLGNPVSFRDPYGEVATLLTGAVGAAGGAVLGGYIAWASGGDWRQGAIRGGIAGGVAGLTLGLAGPALAGAFGGGVLGGVVAGAVSSGAGNVAAQGYGLATGTQQCFSGEDLGISMALGGAFGALALRPYTAPTQTVTSWAPRGVTPDLNPGRWVMTGGSTPRNWALTGTGYPPGNSLSSSVSGSNLAWPQGWEAIKGQFGQRIVVP